jgi:hypothetical protein
MIEVCQQSATTEDFYSKVSRFIDEKTQVIQKIDPVLKYMQ